MSQENVPVCWKVNSLHVNGAWYFSGPFTTHEAAEQFAVRQGGLGHVVAVLIAAWDFSDPHAGADVARWADILKDLKAGHG